MRPPSPEAFGTFRMFPLLGVLRARRGSRPASPDTFCASRWPFRSGASRARSEDAPAFSGSLRRVSDVFRSSAHCVRNADRIRFRRRRCSPSGRFPGSPISPLLRCRPFGAAPLRRSAPARDSGRSRRRRRSAASAPCGGTQKSVLCRAIFRSARFESRSARRSAAPLTQPVSVGSEIDICPTMTSSPSLLCGPFGPCSPPPSGAPCLRAFGAGGASPPLSVPRACFPPPGKA